MEAKMQFGKAEMLIGRKGTLIVCYRLDTDFSITRNEFN